PSLLACTLAAAMNANAEPVQLDIPSQGLAGALDALARQADLQLLYSPDTLRNTTAPAIRGNMEPEQAQRLL
ncbi:STN domain-containing protein, partial [Pseudomonas putida]|nr:STN domain-containing protein [Pseudomonas putida]